MLHVNATPRADQRVRRAWLRIFLIGLALWLATAVVTFATGNPNLVPTLVLLGSFLVPVTFVAWAFEHRDTGEITAGLVFNTFITGGVLGVLGASVLERVLYGISGYDPVTFVTVPAALFAIGLLAALVPARRAAKVDPNVALRQV